MQRCLGEKIFSNGVALCRRHVFTRRASRTPGRLEARAQTMAIRHERAELEVVAHERAVPQSTSRRRWRKGIHGRAQAELAIVRQALERTLFVT